MKCPRCGKEHPTGSRFCDQCGFQFQTNQIPQMNQMPQMNQFSQQKKSNKKALVIILSCVAVLILAAIIAIFIFRNKDSNSSDKYEASENVIPTNNDSQPESPAEEQTPDTGYTETVPETIQEEDIIEHTIMIYMVGSNLEHDIGFGSMDILEMVAANYGENTRIVLQTGGCSDWQLDVMTDGQVERWELCGDNLIKLQTLGEMSMLQVDALADFITFAAETYPAEKYSLVMWDHGGGVPIAFGCDDMFPYDTLYDYQIGEALAQAGVYFECVAFDACHMCTLEVAMAIKDCAKYMVAAESTINGSGMDYTSWLNCYEEDDAVLLDSYEVMAMTYMDSLNMNEIAGSISVIDLKKIPEVYNAYVAYISSVHEDILNNGYTEYALARGNCGLYGQTESVDIITLATMYPNNKSTDLINATVNAVCYTESDYAFGHGLAVYNPNKMPEYYRYARENLNALGYDTKLLDFYDDVVSIGLAFCGTDYVNTYADDWYNAEIANAYTGTDYEPGEYPLEIVQMEGYQAIPLSQEDWSIISNIEVNLFVMFDSQNYYSLGSDTIYTTDENGYIIVEKPQLWTMVNGNIACYICADYWEDESSGEWSMTSGIIAKCNGEPILMVVYYDNNHPQGTILGYYLYDLFADDSINEFTPFADDDVVEIVLPSFNASVNEYSYSNLSGNSYYASDLELTFGYIDFGDYSVSVQYEITDIYENTYSTDWIDF